MKNPVVESREQLAIVKEQAKTELARANILPVSPSPVYVDTSLSITAEQREKLIDRMTRVTADKEKKEGRKNPVAILLDTTTATAENDGRYTHNITSHYSKMDCTKYARKYVHGYITYDGKEHAVIGRNGNIWKYTATVTHSASGITLELLDTAKQAEEQARAEQIEKEGLQYDEDQWESVLNKFGEVEEDCAKCEFSEEQLRQKGEYEGRVATALARYASQKLGEEMKNLGVKMQNSLIEFEGVAKGIADGMETFSHEMEGFSEQFKGIAEQFEGIMNGLIEDKK